MRSLPISGEQISVSVNFLLQHALLLLQQLKHVNNHVMIIIKVIINFIEAVQPTTGLE